MKIDQEKLDKSRDIYKTYMEKYNKEHAACPKCNALFCSITLVGYPFTSEHPDGYKDKNRCVCLNCGDIHIKHDRVPKK